VINITVPKDKVVRVGLLVIGLVILSGLVVVMAQPKIEAATVTQAAQEGIAHVIPVADTLDEFLQESAPYVTQGGQEWHREFLDAERFQKAQAELKKALGDDLEVEIISAEYADVEGLLPGDPVVVRVQGRYVGSKGEMAFDRYFFMEKEDGEWLFTGHHIGAGGAK